MARGPTTEDVRREIEAERQKLTDAVDDLRGAADVTAIVRSKLPAFAAGAAGAGFLVAGGVRATMRLLTRRGR